MDSTDTEPFELHSVGPADAESSEPQRQSFHRRWSTVLFFAFMALLAYSECSRKLVGSMELVGVVVCQCTEMVTSSVFII